MEKHRILVVLWVAVLLFSGCGLFAQTRPEKKKDPKQEAHERRAAYLANHPDLPEEISQAISRGDVVRGMTTNQVIASLGHAQVRQVSMPYTGADLEWIYRYPIWRESHSYTDTGVFTRRYIAGYHEILLRFMNGRLVASVNLGKKEYTP